MPFEAYQHRGRPWIEGEGRVQFVNTGFSLA